MLGRVYGEPLFPSPVSEMTTSSGTRLLVLTCLALAVPVAGSAQAVCSAPHSSPTLAGGGSLSTLPQGAGWFQVSLLGQVADEFFSDGGARRAFIGDSRFVTRSAFLTGAVGVLPGVEVWGQVPVHRLRVEDPSDDATSTGVGDLRFAVRLGSEAVGLDLPLALRLGAKLPGSDFPVDATVLPLTEGQRDWEASLESGTTLPIPGSYVMGWVGHRWREENREARRQPGDEIFAHLALGGSTGRLHFELAADGLWGDALTAQGFLLPGETRSLVQLLPTLGWDTGPGRLEATGQIPLSGENLPVGTGVSVGYRITWGMAPALDGSLLDALAEGR